MNHRLREDFIARLAKNGIQPDDARKFLRYGATLRRLAVAQCNGTYPADNGQRKVEACAKCESLWATYVLKRHPQHKGTAKPLRYCPVCRTKAHVRALCTDVMYRLHPGRDPFEEGLPSIEPHFSGDPRGCVLKLRIPGDRGNDFGGEGLVCVPS